ncbi:MAG TPA: RHS repeat domain-containing protein, partial [Cyclobacteriaceae bacterium]|nr:RHS repeat domain-containing protein [Cyclobacteriaceae bacterium]
LGVLRSSGKLMSFPKYAYGEFYITNELDGSHIALIKLKSFSYSNVPLGSSAQSSPVGYDKVVEKTGRLGSSGYTEYYYTNLPDTEPEPFFPNSPTTSNAAGNGLLLRRVDRNNNHFKVAETLNEYNSEYISMVRGCDILAYSCGSLEMFLTGNYQYVFKNYILQSRWWFKTRSEERTYDLADTSNRRYLSLQYSYRYNPDHKLVIGADMINSEGERVSHHTFYPLDATQLAPGEMWNERDPDYKHLHSYPIRELTTITKGQATEIVLEKINHFQYDTSTSRIILTQVAAANNGQPPETKVRFTKHDAKSNFIEYIKYGRNESEEIVTSVLWSYHQALPVAIIENASFSEVSGAAVKCGVNLLELSNMTDELMILDNLLLIRKELPAARMNIYTYEESVGITSITDPNGKKTYYQYDDLQRLKTVNDFEGNKVNEYEYGYQTMTIKK